VIVVVGAILAFAAVGVVVAAFSALVGRRPEFSAVMLLVAVAGGGVLLVLAAVLGLGIVGVGVVDIGQSSSGVGGRTIGVAYDRVRLAAGLGGAAALLGFAGWLIRTGDWRRVDDPD
jgi:hypothetical protein